MCPGRRTGGARRPPKTHGNIVDIEQPDPYRKHRLQLMAVARRIVGDATEAEYIVHEAYLRLLEAAPDDLRVPAAWLTTAATRLAIDRLRRKSSEQQAVRALATDSIGELAAGAPSSESLAMRWHEVAQVLRQLSERAGDVDATLLVLRHAFDVDYAVLAELLDEAEATVRQRLHRARLRGLDRASRPSRTAVAGDMPAWQRMLAALRSRDDRALLAWLSATAARRAADTAATGLRDTKPAAALHAGPQLRCARRATVSGTDALVLGDWFLCTVPGTADPDLAECVVLCAD